MSLWTWELFSDHERQKEDHWSHDCRAWFLILIETLSNLLYLRRLNSCLNWWLNRPFCYSIYRLPGRSMTGERNYRFYSFVPARPYRNQLDLVRWQLSALSVISSLEFPFRLPPRVLTHHQSQPYERDSIPHFGDFKKSSELRDILDERRFEAQVTHLARKSWSRFVSGRCAPAFSV